MRALIAGHLVCIACCGCGPSFSTEIAASDGESATAITQENLGPRDQLQSVANEPARALGLPADISVSSEIVYKEVDGVALDLWLCRPTVAKPGPVPLVVYIHGGGWVRGGKETFRKYGGVARGLLNAGVACATIEYRLAEANRYTAVDSVSDCKDAVRFLRENAARYDCDGDRIGLFGTSAGANLALLTAMGDDAAYSEAAETPIKTANVCCVATFYAPTTFLDPDLLSKSSVGREKERLKAVLGGPLSEKMDVARLMSPAESVKRGGPPILLVHGDRDRKVPFEHAVQFRNAAQKAAVPVELIVVEGGDHGFADHGITPTVAEINARTVSFLVKHLSAGAAAPSAAASE